MNGQGSELFSHAVVDLLRQYDAFELNESDYFYSSFIEMDRAESKFFNTWYDYEEISDEIIITAQSHHSGNVVPEYRFTFKANESEEYAAVQGYSTQNEVRFVANDVKGGILKIEARAVGSTEEFEQYFE
jgi:hypothetical protein